MVLNQTTLGELYQSLSQEEIKGLELYLQKNTVGKQNILFQLHKLMADAKLQAMLGKLDTDFIKSELFGGDDKSISKLTTYNNLLINHIKDFLILSKIKEKNIYTETLWGEILIERGLKRNLLLKLTTFKFDLYKDPYALMKKFFHDRESFFYSYLTLAKKNYVKMIDEHKTHILSFKNYVNFYLLESYIGLVSLSKSGNVDTNSDFEVKKYLEDTIIPSNKLIRINYFILNLEFYQSIDAYYDLKKYFSEDITLWSNSICVQLIPILDNYTQNQVIKGNDIFEKESYDFLSLVYKSGVLFNRGIFTIVRVLNFIRLELMFGTAMKAKQILEESLPLVSSSQKESFQSLAVSRITFADKDFNHSLLKISTINPSDSIYYFPRYKIMLIKNYIMLADIDRLMAERENFYKYLHNQKNIQEDEKRRHKLFIKYSEYLTNARYEYLTDYMKKRIENALLQTSPYFSEKQWVRERWEELKSNS